MAEFQDLYDGNNMLSTFKHAVDYLSSPTISFTLLTVLTPLVFPPTDWFDNINRKLKIYKIWSRPGLAIAMSAITFFFAVGYMDENFSVILMKGDNFPIVLMVYSISVSYTHLTLPTILLV